MASPSPSHSSISGAGTVVASPSKLPQQLPSTSDQSLSNSLPLNPNPNPSPSPSISEIMDPGQTQGLAAAAAAMQRGSVSRLGQLQFAAGGGRVFNGGSGAAGQMSFGNVGQQQQQQQQLLAARAAAAMGGFAPMQAAAGMGMGLGQRQKGIVQGAQLSTPNMVQSFQGMQSMGTLGNVALNPSMRANSPMLYNQQAFPHGQVRSQQLSSQTMITSPQKLPGQGLTRVQMQSLDSPLSTLSQNGQSAQMNFSSQQQPWLKQMQVPGSPSPSYQLQQQPMSQRQAIMQQLCQRGLTQQQIVQFLQSKPELFGQQHAISQQHNINQQQQQLALQQLQQQQQQQSPRISGLAQQKSLTGSLPETPVSGGSVANATTPHGPEAANQLGKRKIQDLVAQIDPHGKLDPEVEDALLEIADEFIDSVTTFACSLAKHRKSSILEAKDVLLHLEKNWNLTIPGFSREDKPRNTLK